jgi:hypothetical protein
VNVDLTDILDPSTDLAATPPVMTYKGDVNNVPFGLSVAFATHHHTCVGWKLIPVDSLHVQ